MGGVKTPMNVHLQLDLADEGSGGGRTTRSCIARKVVVGRMAVCGEHARAVCVQTVYRPSVLVTIIDSCCHCRESLLLSRVVVVVSCCCRESSSWSQVAFVVMASTTCSMHPEAASATCGVHPNV